MAGVPDWIPPVQAAGVQVKVIPTDEFFPHMAQAIGASDQVLKDRPELVRKFVKAALRGMKDIMDNTDQAAEDFVNDPDYAPFVAARRQCSESRFQLIDDTDLAGTISYLRKG